MADGRGPVGRLPGASQVCEKCEKKLSKVICPDKWKEGASNTIEGGGRKVNENKLLSKAKRWARAGCGAEEQMGGAKAASAS